MKGIILAGGLGTRLYPATRSLSKQLLPVYDKPMIYYSISTLLQAGITNILIITTPYEQSMFKKLLGDGSQWGVQFSYCIQPNPDGIAHAFLISESFIGADSVCLILGDNIVYGEGLVEKMRLAATEKEGATIFSYYVRDPERYGVITFDEQDRPKAIIEKPQTFVSPYAVIGIYFYDNQIISIAKQLTPSKRHELEITDVNQHYLMRHMLRVKKLGRGTAWLDTGTHQSLLDAANFIHVLEQRQGLKIGCPEEVAWRQGYISTKQLKILAQQQIKSGYGEYLLSLLPT